jgi:hypothetical protein
MLHRKTRGAWLGVLLVAFLFFSCQEPRPLCNDQDGDGYGSPPSEACPSPLLAKALAYSENFQEVHAPGLGCSVEVEFAPDGSSTILAYHDPGDSTIWTGNYVVADVAL